MVSQPSPSAWGGVGLLEQVHAGGIPIVLQVQLEPAGELGFIPEGEREPELAQGGR